MSVTLARIEDAACKLENVIERTPLQYCARLSEKYRAKVYLKREDLQEVRSFKIRGAYYKMILMSDADRARGVVTASAGNHAQGVAYSCHHLRTNGTIFMPVTTPNQKIEKVKQFGGDYVEIRLTGNTFDEASEAANAFAADTGAVQVHPFNDEEVIAGQGTIGREIYEDLDGKLDLVVATIGGGGLSAGIASYLKAKDREIQVFGAEPEGADSMARSLRDGHIVSLDTLDTFVDGAAVRTVGDITFGIIRDHVEDVVVVPVGAICAAMIDLYQSEGIIAEPAGALSVAALDALKYAIKGKTVVVVVSGGNNDILRYPEILERSLVYRGLKHYFIVEFAQKPGQLKNFLNVLGPDDDIVLFEYVKKTNKETGPALVGIELRRRDDLEPLLRRLDGMGIGFRKINSDEMEYRLLV